MKKFKINKILVPVDFSNTSLIAVDKAVEMAELSTAELFLLYVSPFEPEINYLYEEEPALISEKQEDNSAIARLADKIRTATQLTVHSHISIGMVTEEVLIYAEQNDIDIILMGTHGVSGFREFIVGSNTYRIVHKASIPVLSYQRASVGHAMDTIVLPLDETIHSRERVEHAIEIAEKFNSTVHLLGIMIDTDPVSQRRLTQVIEQANEYLKKHSIKTIKVEKYISDKPASETIAYAESVNAALIIIMTEEGLNVGGSLGNYTEYMVNHSKIPILSVAANIRPELIELHPYGF